MRCEVTYNDKQIGIMVNNQSDVKLISCPCLQVTNQCRVCKNCQKLRRLLQRLARSSTEATDGSSTQLAQPSFNPEPTNICLWDGCGQEHDNIHELLSHVETHIPRLLNLPLDERQYICQWDGCRSVKLKRKLLLAHIKSIHTGILIQNQIQWNPVNSNTFVPG